MLKHNAWVTIKTLFGVTATLATLTIWGCNKPSLPTTLGETLLDSKLTDLVEKEIHQQLDTTNIQQYEKTVAICPDDLAEINVVIDSTQDERTSSLYLTNVTMTVTQNEGFQIEVGERGEPINLGTESNVVMAVPYLVTCSKASYFSQLFGQNMIEIYADGRVQVQ